MILNRFRLIFLLLVIMNAGKVVGQDLDTGSQTYCNPLNISYRFALTPPSRRTAADPCITLFKDEYYLTATQSGGYWHSKDLLHWDFVTTKDLPLEIDAPTTVVIGGYLYYFPMSSHIIYRSKNPDSGKWEKATDSFPLIEGDPYVLVDTDRRVYYYFGCTNNGYLSAVELDTANNFKPIGTPVHCVTGNPALYGWERVGDYNTLPGKPWTEASWVTRYKGKYYYQFSAPGTEYKSYADGYYVSDHPLGPFTYSPNSPFSSKPGGFICGAGHSATFQDKYGNWWHIVTMTISVKDKFERRLGLFPATFDNEGNLTVHTEFGDYPMGMPDHKIQDVSELFPGWMLLSYKKSANASSSLDTHPPALAFDEEIRDFWSAQTGNKGEWLSVDLGSESTVKAIQINFAENNTQLFGRVGIAAQQYLVEYSNDKKTWTTLIDETRNEEDLTHRYHVLKSAIKARYLKVTNYRVPGGTFAVSGFRVFGTGTGRKPNEVGAFEAIRDSVDPKNVRLSWKRQPNAIGYNIRFGLEKDKLYRNYQVYDSTDVTIHSLNKDQTYWFAIDAFGENGIARGSAGAPVTDWPKAPAVLPGKGPGQFDFFYAGEAKVRNMYIVRKGKITWSYTDTAGKGEISDAVLMTNGNILFAHQFGITLIGPDKKVLWNYDTPAGFETHTAQPIGNDHVVFIQNGDPAELIVINIKTGQIEKRFSLPVKNPKSVHGQFRHARLTPDGTILVAHMDLGKVCEYDMNGNQLLSIDVPGVWSAEPLKNGHILVAGNKNCVQEIDRKGNVVWDCTFGDLADYAISSPQIAIRLSNGNTLVNNWFNQWGSNPDLSNSPVQAVEITPEKKVVWALRAWTAPLNLGPSTTIQLLGGPDSISEKAHFGTIE